MDKGHDQIIATLSGNKKPLTITEIATISGLNRHTVARQLDVLEILGKVRKIEQGNAKKFYLVVSVPVSGLIDISSDLIVIVDKDLIVHYVNSAAAKKLGLAGNFVGGERLDLLNADIFSSDKVIEGLKNYSPNKVFRTEISHTDGCIYGISILELALEVGKNLIAITAEDITEKKRIEKTIFESEEKYKALFTACADPFFLIDQETGRIIDANPAASRVYGYDHAELLTLKNTDLSYEPEKTKQATRKTRSFIPLRFHKDKNGRVFPVEFTASNLTIQGRLYILATGRDITRRIKAEVSRLQSEEAFRLIAETIDEAFWMADVHISKNFYISPSYERIWGRTRESLCENPQSFIDSIHPDDKERIIADYEVKKKGMAFDHEYRIIHPDGTIRYIWDRGFPVTDNQGRVYRYVGVAMDISERKIAEKAIFESEERYHAIFDQSPIAIELFDAEGMLIRANRSFLTMFGITDIEDIRKLSFLSYPHLTGDLKQQLQRRETVHLQAPFDFDQSKAGNYFQSTREGIIWLDILITPLGEKIEPITGYMVQILDITKEKVAEREHDETSKKLRLLTTLGKNDIYNQTNALHLALDLALNTSDRTTLEDSLTLAQISTTRIEKIFGFTRTYEKLIKNSRIWISVHEIIRSTVADMILDQSIIENSTAENLEMYADPIIRKVFMTLLENSSRHGGEITSIRIFSYHDGDSLVIVYEDDGIGIPEENKEAIFHQGYGKDTGIGLFLISMFLSLNGMSISETGTPGMGARFEIRVPGGAFRYRS